MNQWCGENGSDRNDFTNPVQIGPEITKLFSYSTQLNEHVINHAYNVKMSTIVGILTFISMINSTSESLKARDVFIFQYFSFSVQMKFDAQLLNMKKVL